MKFVLLIYTDDALLNDLPAGRFESRMRDCLAHADEMRQEGRLLDSQMLETPASAKSVRIRNGRRMIIDGPFAETKELLAGFNVIEAADMEEALRMADEFPWAQTGCIEVRPVQDVEAVRQRVNGLASSARVACD